METELKQTRGRPREFNKTHALNAAMIQFWANGYEGTSISLLAKAMKINSPSLYAAFGSKEELYFEAINQYVKTYGEPLVLALYSPAPVRDAVKEMLVRAAKQFSRTEWPKGCMVANGALRCGIENHEVAKATASLRMFAQESLRQRLFKATKDGELSRNTDVRSLSAFYSSVVQGMSVQAVDGASRKQLIKIAEFAMNAWPTD